MGLLYLGGGLFLLSRIRQLWVIDAMEAGLAHVAGRPAARDRTRVVMIGAGALLTAAAGAALLLLHRAAPAVTLALVLHQALYIGFAQWRAVARGDASLRAQQPTVNAAVLSLAVLGLALALEKAGRLG